MTYRTPVVGLYGRQSADLAEGLSSRGIEVTQFGSIPNPIELRDTDCLVLDVSGQSTDGVDVYDRVRSMHSTQPLVFVTATEEGSLLDAISDDPNAERIPRTKDGVPIALLSSRCKRFAGGGGASIKSSIQKTANTYRTGGITFYGLWAFAIATYGIGDFVSTLVALLFVPGLFEGNPIVLAVLQRYGIAGFVGIKVVVFAGALWMGIRGARDSDWFGYYAPPIVVGIVGTALTVWNTLLITGTVG